MKTVLKMLSLILALSLALGALQIGAYAALNDGKKLTAVVKLEVGRMSGSTFTPLKDGENIAKDQVITVRIVPETDFLCGTVRFAVLFGKNAFTIIGSQKSAFTPNPSNTYYAKAVGDYSGATYVPLKVFQEVYGASAGQTMFNAYTAVCVTAQAQSNAANGGPGVFAGHLAVPFQPQSRQKHHGRRGNKNRHGPTLGTNTRRRTHNTAGIFLQVRKQGHVVQ